MDSGEGGVAAGQVRRQICREVCPAHDKVRACCRVCCGAAHALLQPGVLTSSFFRSVLGALVADHVSIGDFWEPLQMFAGEKLVLCSPKQTFDKADWDSAPTSVLLMPMLQNFVKEHAVQLADALSFHAEFVAPPANQNFRAQAPGGILDAYLQICKSVAYWPAWHVGNSTVGLRGFGQAGKRVTSRLPHVLLLLPSSRLPHALLLLAFCVDELVTGVEGAAFVMLLIREADIESHNKKPASGVVIPTETSNTHALFKCSRWKQGGTKHGFFSSHRLVKVVTPSESSVARCLTGFEECYRHGVLANPYCFLNIMNYFNTEQVVRLKWLPENPQIEEMEEIGYEGYRAHPACWESTDTKGVTKLELNPGTCCACLNVLCVCPLCCP